MSTAVPDPAPTPAPDPAQAPSAAFLVPCCPGPCLEQCAAMAWLLLDKLGGAPEPTPEPGLPDEVRELEALARSLARALDQLIAESGS